jgi:hypothetical protein
MRGIEDWLDRWADRLLLVVVFLLLIDFIAILALLSVWGSYSIIHEMMK